MSRLIGFREVNIFLRLNPKTLDLKSLILCLMFCMFDVTHDKLVFDLV